MNDQPLPSDLVLGGNAHPHNGGLGHAVILGGISAVRQGLDHADEHRRKLALGQAINYGVPGLNLVIQALGDKSRLVQKTAYNLLKNRREHKCQQAIATYNPYGLFECVQTLKTSSVLAISKDGKAIATRQAYGRVKVWSIDEREVLYELPPISNSLGVVALGEEGRQVVRSLSVTRSGTASRLELWRDGELVSELVGHSDKVSAICFSHDGSVVATGSHDCSIKLWDTNRGKLVCTFSSQLISRSHRGSVVALSFSPNDRLLYSGGHDMMIKVWDWERRQGQTLVPKTNAVAQLAVGRDRLVSLGYGREIQVWQAQDGKFERSLEGHTAPINEIALSPNQQVLASVSNDHTLRFWQLETGDNFYTPSRNNHDQHIHQVAFSADGQRLITTGANQVLKVWAVPS